jgi:hypothetical protein
MSQQFFDPSQRKSGFRDFPLCDRNSFFIQVRENQVSGIFCFDVATVFFSKSEKIRLRGFSILMSQQFFSPSQRKSGFRDFPLCDRNSFFDPNQRKSGFRDFLF